MNDFEPVKVHNDLDKELLTRYLDGTLDSEETARLMEWVRESPDNERMLFELKSISMSMNYDSSREMPWMDEEWNQIRERTGMKKESFRLKWWHWAAISACILAAVFLCLPYSLKPVPTQDSTVTFLTGYGQQAETILPDGSTVRLNSCSRISYDPSTWAKQRRISLQGGAAFDIFRNEKAPLKVITSNCTVSVLGTSFDVNDYNEDRETIVSLKSGSVNVDLDGKTINLSPGQTFRLDRESNDWNIRDNVEGDFSWEDGTIVFDNISLEKMQHSLLRRFGYTFDIAPNCRSRQFRAHLEHESLSEFMDILTTVAPDIHYDIDHKTKTVHIYKTTG